MSCFPCFSSQRSKKIKSKRDHSFSNSNDQSLLRSPETKKKKGGDEAKKEKNQAENGNIAAENFTFRDLATATNNFKQECLLGEGGFGRVYKGTLKTTNQVVAVKQLDRNGLQGNKEFLVEVLMLSLLHHPNLVNLVGYCADGDQRLLVYEYMSGGSVEDHLLDVEEGQEVLDWYTRIKIASGAAKGLEYLHDKANPPVIYRDLKSSNILLDHEYNPKLSDFGLAKLGHVGDKMHVSSRVMGTYGYCAPEYAKTGQLTLKSDVYSFGVVLLELITGRRAIDTTRATNQQNLVAWALPLFRDPTKYPAMADPLLKGNFPEKDLNQAVAIAAMCLQEEASVRPLISDVVTTLSFLSSVPPPTPLPSSTSLDPFPREEDENSDLSNAEEEGGEEGKDEETEKDEEASKNEVEIRENGWSPTSSGKSSRKSDNGSFSSTHVRRSSKIPEKAVAWSRNSSLSSKKSFANEEPVLSHKTSKAESGRHGHGSSRGSEVADEEPVMSHKTSKAESGRHGDGNSWGSEVANEEPVLSHKTSKAESGRHGHGSSWGSEVADEEPVLTHKTSKAESTRHGHGSSWGSEEESAYSFSPNSESFQKSFHKKEGSQSGKVFSKDNDMVRGSENRTVSF